MTYDFDLLEPLSYIRPSELSYGFVVTHVTCGR